MGIKRKHHEPTIVVHLNSGIELEVITDDLTGMGYGTIVLRDCESLEEHTLGGTEFEMEYEYK